MIQWILAIHVVASSVALTVLLLISGILNDIRNRGNNSYCYSTLTITPGKLDNETSEVTPCMTLNSANLLTNVSCTTSGATNTEPKSLPFQIAGMLYYYYNNT